MEKDEVRHYLVIENLHKGSEVTIRAIRPEDKGLIIEAFEELDENTIYTRFFALKKNITDQELKWATEIDFLRNAALVACILESGRERIIGVGRYIATEEPIPPSSAEMAFVVEEDYHGLGLAFILLRHLVLIGRKHGISRFEVEVLPANKAMLRVFSRAGLPMTTAQSGDSIQIAIFLNKGGTE